MYELACPSCGVKRATPFVRLGAVTRCDACSTVYRIGPPHVTRPQPAGAKPAAPAPDRVLITDPPPPDDPAGGSSITGLSGLSELMQAEPGGTPMVGADTAPGPSSAPGPLAAATLTNPAEDLRAGLSQVPEVNAHGSTRAATLHRKAVELNRQRRARRRWFVLIASLAAFVGLIGVGLLILYGVSGDLPGDSTPEAAPQRAPQATPNPAPQPAPDTPSSTPSATPAPAEDGPYPGPAGNTDPTLDQPNPDAPR